MNIAIQGLGWCVQLGMQCVMRVCITFASHLYRDTSQAKPAQNKFGLLVLLLGLLLLLLLLQLLLLLLLDGATHQEYQ